MALRDLEVCEKGEGGSDSEYEINAGCETRGENQA